MKKWHSWELIHKTYYISKADVTNLVWVIGMLVAADMMQYLYVISDSGQNCIPTAKCFFLIGYYFANLSATFAQLFLWFDWLRWDFSVGCVESVKQH